MLMRLYYLYQKWLCKLKHLSEAWEKSVPKVSKSHVHVWLTISWNLCKYWIFVTNRFTGTKTVWMKRLLPAIDRCLHTSAHGNLLRYSFTVMLLKSWISTRTPWSSNSSVLHSQIYTNNGQIKASNR